MIIHATKADLPIPIQIQHLLKLNLWYFYIIFILTLIQIQHLLKLNHKFDY